MSTIELGKISSNYSSRSSIDDGENSENDDLQDDTRRNEFFNLVGENPVILVIDRPQSSQIILNDVCQKGSIPYVSIKTAGCYGRVFCDFGDVFHDIDEDGEAPQVTLLQKVELSQEDDVKKVGYIEIHCVEGEHHDVSKGDKIWKAWSFKMNFMYGSVL